MNRDSGTVCLILLIAALVFCSGINWGLPTRDADHFLLGSDLHGDHLEALTSGVPDVDTSRGADVVAPTGDPNQPVVLNRTPADAARILCRYRLYSFQPDEMITFRALSAMHPSEGDLDPRLYQYGGLWIYPVAAIIEVAGHTGLLQITDRARYIANPELFGRFYIVARAYSAAWGLVAVWAVYFLARRMIGSGHFLPALAAVCFTFMPVVVDMAHEAKPHLAGTALILLAILAADNYARTKSAKWILISGALVGAATGMVLWGAIGIAVLICLACRSPGNRRQILVLGTLTAAVVYFVTNPYVLIHLLHDRSALRGNLGNSSGMYHFGRPDLAILNGIELLCLGCGPAVLIAGAIAWVKQFRSKEGPERILLIAAVAMLIPFIVMAAGKPGEYARFALLPDTALAIGAIVWCARQKRESLAIAIATITSLYGISYIGGFLVDSGAYKNTSRAQVADSLEHWLADWKFHLNDAAAIADKSALRPAILVYLDPAPFSLPPVDLDGWLIVHLPKDFEAPFGFIVTPYQQSFSLDPRRTPISWANMGFQIRNKAVGTQARRHEGTK